MDEDFEDFGIQENAYGACNASIKATNRFNMIFNYVFNSSFFELNDRDKHDYYVNLLWNGIENHHNSTSFITYFIPKYLDYDANREKKRFGWTFLWENLFIGFSEDFKFDLGLKKRKYVYSNRPNGFNTFMVNMGI